MREWEFNLSTVWARIELEQREKYVRLGVQESLHRETEKDSSVACDGYQVHGICSNVPVLKL